MHRGAAGRLRPGPQPRAGRRARTSRWTVSCPWLDTVSHAPYSLSPSLWNGIGNGIPVPLFNLVYHDAVLVHWNSFQASLGSWGIPNNDRYSTHAALNANPAYLSIDAGEEEIAECTALCELSRSLAFERMIRHEFLSGNFRRAARHLFRRHRHRGGFRRGHLPGIPRQKLKSNKSILSAKSPVDPLA